MADQTQDPEYLFAQTGHELERLRKQYAWLQVCLKNQLVFAPIDLQQANLKVLDVGCADGTFLRALQPQLAPTAQLVGADVMPSFLPKDDTGISYVLQDVGEPFQASLQNAFDLTNVRFVLAGAAKAGLHAAVTHLVGSLVPGGWLQIVELDNAADAPGYTQSLRDLFALMRILFGRLGMPENWALELEEVFKQVGLQNVSVRRVEFPLGRKMGSDEGTKNSVEPFKFTIPSVIGGCEQLGAELPPKVTDKLFERFEKEMNETGGTIHGLIVIGQKKTT